MQSDVTTQLFLTGADDATSTLTRPSYTSRNGDFPYVLSRKSVDIPPTAAVENFDSRYRKSAVELTSSLLPGSSMTRVSADSDSDSEQSADEIMKRQTLRIVVYVSIMLLLTCGVISYDVGFCMSQDIGEIMYKSPPCNARDIFRGGFNLFYTGN